MGTAWSEDGINLQRRWGSGLAGKGPGRVQVEPELVLEIAGGGGDYPREKSLCVQECKEDRNLTLQKQLESPVQMLFQEAALAASHVP